MTANKDDLDLWDEELRAAGCDPLSIEADVTGIAFVESSVSAWKTSITVYVPLGRMVRLTFVRSAAGGPVVQVWPDGRVEFIDRPEDYGDFTADKQSWVARFFYRDDDEHNGCGCCQDSYYDDDEDFR